MNYDQKNNMNLITFNYIADRMNVSCTLRMIIPTDTNMYTDLYTIYYISMYVYSSSPGIYMSHMHVIKGHSCIDEI